MMALAQVGEGNDGIMLVVMVGKKWAQNLVCPPEKQD